MWIIIKDIKKRRYILHEITTKEGIRQRVFFKFILQYCALTFQIIYQYPWSKSKKGRRAWENFWNLLIINLFITSWNGPALKWKFTVFWLLENFFFIYETPPPLHLDMSLSLVVSFRMTSPYVFAKSLSSMKIFFFENIPRTLGAHHVD